MSHVYCYKSLLLLRLVSGRTFVHDLREDWGLGTTSKVTIFDRWSSAVHDAGVPSKCKHPVLETDSNHLFEKVHMAMWQYRLEMAANSCVIPGQDQRIWHLWASTPWVVHHVSVLWGLAWLWAEPMPDRKYDCIYQEFGLWTQEIYTCFRF